MGTLRVRDVSLFVDVVGHGPPLLLMHGGPGADHWTLLPFRRLADEFTLVFYDHRCNGRSDGGSLSSMTWANLTADADALREALGYERWAVLGHSFGGKVALEYALRYPDRLSRLVLLDTGGDSRWAQENAWKVLAGRGFSPATVRFARRWFNGRIEPREFFPGLLRLGRAYNPHTGLGALLREGFAERRSKARPEALIHAGPNLLRGWSVMDRLGEIAAPTLVMAGRDDFIFPPEHQAQLAARIPLAQLRIVERAGHNPHSERTNEVMVAVREFLSTADEQRPTEAATGSGTPSTAVVARRPAGIHVAETGDPASPAVVFLHGGGPSGVMWRRHMDALAGSFHCLAPDLPGFGRSADLAAMSLPATADLIADLIAARATSGRAHVIGLSYGGSVVLALLDRHSDRVDRAVVDGAGVFSSWLDPFVVAGAVAVSPIVSTRPVAVLLGAVGLAGLGVSLSGARPAAVRRAFREGFVAPLSRRQLEATCPTLLVAGEAEHTVRASNAAFAAVMPQADARYVPGLGHAWFAWRPELHIRMVRAWLSGETLPLALESEPPSSEAVQRMRDLLHDLPRAASREGARHG